MGYHNYPIPGQVDVRLDRVGADFDSTAEGPHGVLGEAGLVASMGHGLWETMVDPRLGSRPRRCGRDVFVLANAVGHVWGKDEQIYLAEIHVCRCRYLCLCLCPAPCLPPVDVGLSSCCPAHSCCICVAILSANGIRG